MILLTVLTNLNIAENEQKLNHNVDAELEYARKLLQRCSEIKHSSLAIGKWEEDRYRKST